MHEAIRYVMHGQELSDRRFGNALYVIAIVPAMGKMGNYCITHESDQLTIC